MPPERIDGPTHAGGAYALMYLDASGAPREVVEFAADGTELLRTYVSGPGSGSEGVAGEDEEVDGP